jgi:hypothetical protein
MTDTIDMNDVRLAYHAAVERFIPDSLDTEHWVRRLRTQLPHTRRRKPLLVWRGQAADRPLGSRGRWIASLLSSLIGGTHTSRPEAGQEIEVVVIRAVAPPTAVLGMGHPDVCDEGEILIDPSRLEDVEHVSKIRNAEFSPEWVRSQKWFEEND